MAVRDGLNRSLSSPDQPVSRKREHGATIVTDPSPDEINRPAAPPQQPAKRMGVAGKIVLWVIAAIVLVPIIAVVGTYLSIFFIGYNR